MTWKQVNINYEVRLCFSTLNISSSYLPMQGHFLTCQTKSLNFANYPHTQSMICDDNCCSAILRRVLAISMTRPL
uniref:Ovule protein n=1 Tax=Heterorhabditis bacteriophora TaxID=37862 RepID=A0A1I7W5Z8_HETBA